MYVVYGRMCSFHRFVSEQKLHFSFCSNGAVFVQTKTAKAVSTVLHTKFSIFLLKICTCSYGFQLFLGKLITPKTDKKQQGCVHAIYIRVTIE